MRAPSSATVWHVKWNSGGAADALVQKPRYTGVGSAPLVLPGEAQQDKTRQGGPEREPPAPLPACHQMHCWWPAAAQRCRPPCWSWSGAAGTTQGQAARSGPRSGVAGGQLPRHHEPRWSSPAARTGGRVEGLLLAGEQLTLQKGGPLQHQGLGQETRPGQRSTMSPWIVKGTPAGQPWSRLPLLLRMTRPPGCSGCNGAHYTANRGYQQPLLAGPLPP